jgi:FtsH-binding integral membrane protein
MAPFIPPKKQGFLLSVYGILIVELLVTFFVVYYFRDHPSLSKITKQSIIIYFIASMGLVLLLVFVPMPIWLKFVLFTILSTVLGGLLHQASALLPEELVTQVLAGTIAVFVAMSVVALILASMGIDLSWMGSLLLAALVGLIVASLIVYIVSYFNAQSQSPSAAETAGTMKGIHKILLVIGLILFSVYVMYETNIMLQKNYNEDVVSAALGLYLDFVNIFTHILGLESQ